MTTDAELSSRDLIDLGTRLRDLETDRVQFLTVPVANPNYRKDDISYMLLNEAAAEKVFATLRNDMPLGENAVTPGDEPSSPPGLPPAEVKVKVMNGTMTAGLGARAAEQLKQAGFSVDGAASDAAEKDIDQTLIRYDPAYDDALPTLQAAVPNARAEAVEDRVRCSSS